MPQNPIQQQPWMKFVEQLVTQVLHAHKQGHISLQTDGSGCPKVSSIRVQTARCIRRMVVRKAREFAWFTIGPLHEQLAGAKAGIRRLEEENKALRQENESLRLAEKQHAKHMDELIARLEPLVERAGQLSAERLAQKTEAQ